MLTIVKNGDAILGSALMVAMARVYSRDSNGRFSSAGGGGKKSGGKKGGGKKGGASKAPAATASSGKKKPASKAPAATASKGGKAASGAKSRKPDFKPNRKGATAASVVSEHNALTRLGAGRRLRGKGNNPTARAERVLERGLSSTGKRARKSEATAKRAIDYMASQGTLGKRSKRRKA